MYTLTEQELAQKILEWRCYAEMAELQAEKSDSRKAESFRKLAEAAHEKEAYFERALAELGASSSLLEEPNEPDDRRTQITKSSEDATVWSASLLGATFLLFAVIGFLFEVPDGLNLFERISRALSVGVMFISYWGFMMTWLIPIAVAGRYLVAIAHAVVDEDS